MIEPRYCPITGHELDSHRYAAPAAAGQLRANAADLPDLIHQLELTITRQVRMPQTGGGTPRDERLDFNYNASEAAYVLRQTILINVDEIARTKNQPTPDTWTDIAHALSQWADELTLTERGAEILGELLDALTLAYRTIDRPPDRQYAGPCPQCGTDLTAPHGASEAVCPTCETRTNIEEQHNWMNQQLESMNLPADQARHAAHIITGTPVTRHNLRDWERRGRLAPRGTTWRGDLYNVGELTTLARTKAQRARTA